ncbi:MAG: hypothetical protein LUQ65_10930 [Candidatus Helarchaeota archaeon]|nr:hypothetical protein [Candidatus Helarchaeota archaeon]
MVIENLPRLSFHTSSSNSHPITITHWKKELIEKGPEIFAKETKIHENEKRIEELEPLIGHKEVEIALLKNFLTGISARGKKLS